MATPGLSLVGFMTDGAQAIRHLRRVCVPNPSTKTDAVLTAEWQAAKAQLGTPILNAGNPAIAPIPANHPHVVQLMNDPWSGPAIAVFYPGATFQMVEIDPLFAFQFSIDTSRATSKCTHLSTPLIPDELFPICLPIGEPRDPFQYSLQGQSLAVKARGLNMRLLPVQIAQSQSGLAIQITLAYTPPLVYVTRYQGKCFLTNGFHRAFGIRAAGHTHMPCIFRDVHSYQEAGVLGDDQTFSEAYFQVAANAPTVGHLTPTTACSVMLREASRVLTVNWSEHAVADE